MLRRAAARSARLGTRARSANAAAIEVHRSALAPTYPRKLDAYPNVIMHIGVGGFHRSHQAHYLHELLLRGGDDASWALCGVG
eukprot:CAMPEP_0183352986 /NCGR_PEP_ID=MMETSP0164_2-20130417/31951_1 /TAXON_ID=221442 /ORGANISM="Coccolithus pelagicus ssp braarudi, Strain PLY182g" /LENGTH=82 /DNA_ID=CAMNT_0025525569 /DNA_START=18 /DNA_END=262 /DNA_ORIENTATION=-